MKEGTGLSHPTIVKVLDAWDEKNRIADLMVDQEMAAEVDPFKGFADKGIEIAKEVFAKMGCEDDVVFNEVTPLALMVAASIVMDAPLRPEESTMVSLGLLAIASELGSRVRQLTQVEQLTLDEAELDQLTEGGDGE